MEVWRDEQVRYLLTSLGSEKGWRTGSVQMVWERALGLHPPCQTQEEDAG